MTRPFGPAALHAFGLAARVLGWRPHEFWAATPAELAAALDPPLPPGEGMDSAALTRMMEHDR